MHRFTPNRLPSYTGVDGKQYRDASSRQSPATKCEYNPALTQLGDRFAQLRNDVTVSGIRNALSGPGHLMIRLITLKTRFIANHAFFSLFLLFLQGSLVSCRRYKMPKYFGRRKWLNTA